MARRKQQLRETDPEAYAVWKRGVNARARERLKARRAKDAATAYRTQTMSRPAPKQPKRSQKPATKAKAQEEATESSEWRFLVPQQHDNGRNPSWLVVESELPKGFRTYFTTSGEGTWKARQWLKALDDLPPSPKIDAEVHLIGEFVRELEAARGRADFIEFSFTEEGPVVIRTSSKGSPASGK